MSYPPPPPEQPGQPGQPGQPAQSWQAQPPAYQPGGHYPPAVAPTSSKATTSLILGIISLVACGLLLGIPAMIVGRQAKREIKESGGRVGGDGLATAGFVTGLIGTIWSVLAIIVFVILLAFGAAFVDDVSKSCDTVTDSDGNSTIECNDF